MKAARRRGKDAAVVQKNLQQLETILPDLIDLNKMKAADWVILHNRLLNSWRSAQPVCLWP